MTKAGDHNGEMKNACEMKNGWVWLLQSTHARALWAIVWIHSLELDHEELDCYGRNLDFMLNIL